MTPDDIEPLLPELYVRMVPQSSVLRGLLASMAALLDPQETEKNVRLCANKALVQLSGGVDRGYDVGAWRQLFDRGQH